MTPWQVNDTRRRHHSKLIRRITSTSREGKFLQTARCTRIAAICLALISALPFGDKLRVVFGAFAQEDGISVAQASASAIPLHRALQCASTLLACWLRAMGIGPVEQEHSETESMSVMHWNRTQVAFNRRLRLKWIV